MPVKESDSFSGPIVPRISRKNRNLGRFSGFFIARVGSLPPDLAFKVLQIVQNAGGGFKNRDVGFKGRGFAREGVFWAFVPQAGCGDSFDEGPPRSPRGVPLQIGVLKDTVTVVDHSVDLPILTDPNQRAIGLEKESWQ